MLQTGARAVAEKTVFTLADFEQFLQQIQTFTYRTTTGKRAKVLAFCLFGTTVKPYSRKVIRGGNKNIRVGLIIAQQNIVGGTLCLDQILL